MINNNFFIEVKTKWIEENNVFSREVIRYDLNDQPNINDVSLREKLLKISEKKQEQVDYIESNELEVNAIDKTTGKIIEDTSALINMLLRFTEYKYQTEE